MFFTEYKRLIKSKQTVIIFVLLTIAAISFYMSFSEKQMFVNQLYNDFAEDLNRDRLIQVIENYNGIYFLFRYWFGSDFSQLSVIVVYVWAGVFLTPSLLLQKENGMGNFMVSRTSYKTYVTNVLLTQIAYIFTTISSATALQVVLALVWGGVSGEASIGSYDLSKVEVILVMALQVILFSLLVSFVNGISVMCSLLIKNVYIAQAFPVVVFVVVPMLLGSTLGNLSSVFARIIVYFDVNNALILISNIYQSYFDGKVILYNILPILIYGAVFLSLTWINIKNHERDYL